MSTYQIATKNLGAETAESFIRSVKDVSSYYIFAGKHTPYPSDSIPAPVDSTSSIIQAYNDMLFGKRITDSDINVMINRYNWESSVVYDMYEDTDPDLKDKKYYVLVQEGELYKVYKCLFNNNGGPSLVEPFGTDTNILEIPTDGYIWKYMYSFDAFTADKFLTDLHMPVYEDAAVKAAAVSGSIDVIKIAYAGLGYDNYTVGSFRESSDIIIDSDPLQYGLDGNASLIDNFYNNCLIKITSGAATGEYRLITNYTISGGRRIITIENPFNGTIVRTDTYEIYPNIFLYDTGGAVDEQCVARAIINPSGNGISRVEILNPGKGYRAASAELRPDETVGVDSRFAAELNPIIPPSGGHGYDVNSELNGVYVGISVSFIGNNSPLTARDDSDYRTIGIVKDPLYANVRMFIDSTSTEGQFVRFEDLFRLKHIKLSGNVALNSTNTYVYSTESEIDKSLRINDTVLIVSDSGRVFSKVDSVLDDSTFLLKDQPSFDEANCSIYLVETDYLAKINDVQSTYLDLTDVRVDGFDKSDYLLGNTSLAIGKINSSLDDYVTINNRPAELFLGFNQLTKLYGEIQSDVNFSFDETIVQPSESINDSPKAKLYNYENNLALNQDILYVTNVTDEFVTTNESGSGIISGLTSNAYFISQYKYNGDLVPDSGEILYLENLNPINRSITRSETIKLVLRF